MLDMDQYKASIESVDNALNRLNQTLASYKLLISESSKTASTTTSSAKNSTNGSRAEPSLPQQTSQRAHNGAEAPSKAAASPGNSPIADPKSQPDLSPAESLVRSLRSTNSYPELNLTGAYRARRLEETFIRLASEPYCLPLYLLQAIDFLGLGYPDLASGAAYKALLLSDALDNEAEEYHDEASDSLKSVIQLQPLEERISTIRRAMDAELQSASPTELDPTLDIELVLWLKGHYRLILYRLLARSLLLCGCLRSALAYVKQALRAYPGDRELASIHIAILRSGTKLKGKSLSMDSPPNDWPDSGFVRREQYLWNGYEPDRINMLDELNVLMSNASDKLEVRAVDLPTLGGGREEVSTQLGVFAKTDIAPGEEVLNETSLLTANNKLQDALCDACSANLPDLNSKEGEGIISCPDCEVVFCSQWCYDEAMESYHPALCDKDVEGIAKDVPPAQAADSLYSLLLLRSLAMAETQGIHPLQLHEVKYIWGDFTSIPHIEKIVYQNPNDPGSCTAALTLPFSFEHNVRLPFHMLEKMDIDIFANHQYDVWVFNTLYAKFRGTASARLSGLGGRAIRGPEVSAVHPMWCLANHSCDPNVSWEWGGSIKFWSRKERAAWTGENGQKVVKSKVGIRRGEEVLNHYCDVDLPVKERREWARGALGGDCMCARCVYEAAQEESR